MKFENRGKWFGESAKRFKEEEDLINDEMLALDEDDDFSDLVADDELDLVDDEQPMNEVRYIDPKNLDRYEPDEIEEVTDAQGNKRYKRSGNTGAGRNAQGSYQKKTDAKQGFNQDLANNLLSYGQEDYDEFMNIANQMDPDEYPNDFRRAVAQNTNIPDKVAMDFIDAYDYNDMDKWKNAKAQQQPAKAEQPSDDSEPEDNNISDQAIGYMMGDVVSNYDVHDSSQYPDIVNDLTARTFNYLKPSPKQSQEVKYALFRALQNEIPDLQDGKYFNRFKNLVDNAVNRQWDNYAKDHPPYSAPKQN